MAEDTSNGRGRIARITDSVKRLFSRKHDKSEGRVMRSGRDDVAVPVHTEREQPHARPAHRESDIPLDQLNQSYSPMQTSLKGPFRASGAEWELRVRTRFAPPAASLARRTADWSSSSDVSASPTT